MSKKKTWRKRFPYIAKNLKRVVALTMAGLLLLATIAAAVFAAYAEGEPVLPRDLYTMEIEILDSYGGARVYQQIDYTNRTGQPITSLVFSLPANSYRRSATAPFEESALTGAYPEGFSPGGVEFFSVLVGGEPAEWGVAGDAEDVLRVRCALNPGERATFSFSFDVLLPQARGAFGFTEDYWILSGFYPRAAVYDELLEQFIPLSLSPVGESIYADGADYIVTLYAPALYDLSATGASALLETTDGTAKWSIEGENLRELAMVLHRAVRSKRENDQAQAITVKTGDRATMGTTLAYARAVVDCYEEWFGPPPYGDLVIAQTDARQTHSYPGLIAMPKELFTAARRVGREQDIAYHIARQYFGLWAMNNPDAEPWLSDALCGYVALLYIEQSQSYDAFLRALNDLVLESLQITLPGSLYVDSEKARFASADEYDLVIRRRGAAVMHELRDAVGVEALVEALRLYAQSCGGATASIADFASALNEASGSEMDLYLMEMLRTIGDYANQRLDVYE